MKILFLTQVLPYPLDAGPKTRAYYVLRHLASRGHQITLLSFVRDSDGAEDVAQLAQFCRRIKTVRMERSRLLDVKHLLAGLGKAAPFLIRRDWRKEMAETIQDLVGKHPSFDAVHADQLWMAPYALVARDAVAPGRKLRLILDQHNAVFQIPHRLAETEPNQLKSRLLRQEARKLKQYERTICREFDQVVWVTDEDRRAVVNGDIAHQRSLENHRIIPICVDSRGQATEPDGKPFRVTFLGGLHWPPNSEGVTWFIQRSWPQVLGSVPEARLTVIGKDPPRRLQALAARTEGVELTGYVPDLTVHLRETAVFVVPLPAGSGMRVKILDAWRWGLPVVSTRIGAEGIRVQHEQNLLLADTPEDFSRAVIRVFHEPSLANQLRQQGRAAVIESYDWKRVYPAWDDVYPCESSTSSLTRPA